MIKPGIGRIVHYRDAGADPADKPHAAIVIDVHSDRLVNLACFSPAGTYYHRQDVVLLQDDDAAPADGGYAEWMAFQKGQAPASSAVTEQLGKIEPRLTQVEAMLIADGPLHNMFKGVQQRLDLVEAHLAAAPAPDAPPPPAPQDQTDASGAGQQQANPAPQPDPPPVPPQPDPAAAPTATPQVQA